MDEEEEAGRLGSELVAFTEEEEGKRAEEGEGQEERARRRVLGEGSRSLVSGVESEEDMRWKLAVRLGSPSRGWKYSLVGRRSMKSRINQSGEKREETNQGWDERQIGKSNHHPTLASSSLSSSSFRLLAPLFSGNRYRHSSKL